MALQRSARERVPMPCSTQKHTSFSLLCLSNDGPLEWHNHILKHDKSNAVQILQIKHIVNFPQNSHLAYNLTKDSAVFLQFPLPFYLLKPGQVPRIVCSAGKVSNFQLQMTSFSCECFILLFFHLSHKEAELWIMSVRTWKNVQHGDQK